MGMVRHALSPPCVVAVMSGTPDSEMLLSFHKEGHLTGSGRREGSNLPENLDTSLCQLVTLRCQTTFPLTHTHTRIWVWVPEEVSELAPSHLPLREVTCLSLMEVVPPCLPSNRQDSDDCAHVAVR